MSNRILNHRTKPSTMGLLGESISYSLSPAIHNASAQRLGVNIQYSNFSLASTEVSEFLKQMWQNQAMGFNVTRPYKKLVAQLTDNQKLSSVNTLFRGENGWKSTSTDGDGIAAALSRMGRPLEDFSKIAIIGSGGAAISLLEFLDQRNFRGTVGIAVRKTPSLENFAILQHCSPVIIKTDSQSLEWFIQNDLNCLVIQATSAPLHGDDLRGLLPAFLKFKGSYFDMVYGHDSAILNYCRANDIPCSDGVPMLIEQARASQMLWWGKCESFDFIESTLRKINKK